MSLSVSFTPAQADDLIWWVPLEFEGSTLYVGPYRGFHLCPSAVLLSTQTRETLDWMALGVCRYCGGELPA